jgi:hypothetical protein
MRGSTPFYPNSQFAVYAHTPRRISPRLYDRGQHCIEELLQWQTSFFTHSAWMSNLSLLIKETGLRRILMTSKHMWILQLYSKMLPAYHGDFT